MGNSVTTRIIKIGNSQGIRIPKVLLDQAKLGNEIDIEVKGNQLIISTASSPRQGWDEQFAKMSERGNDKLLDSESANLSFFDADEWEWK